MGGAGRSGAEVTDSVTESNVQQLHFPNASTFLKIIHITAVGQS